MTAETTASDVWSFAVERRSDPASAEARAAILADPAFGQAFTDHMVVANWSVEQGWFDQKVTAYAPLRVSPAAAVLHYAQEIFEGLKAYRHADGSVWAFRPERNAARFAASAQRLALPQLPEGAFVAALRALVTADEPWVPSAADGETSLYLRPYMIATEAALSVRPSHEVLFGVIASPAGPYFDTGPRPVSIWLTTSTIRATPGGTGAAKCGGNYAASLAGLAEAVANGCEQVAFVEAVEHKWLEEIGSMNMFFVYADGRVVTPELSGSILAGVTRASVLELAAELGHPVEERQISADEWKDGVRSGEITEVFASGTAAVITPIGRLAWPEGDLTIGDHSVDHGVGPVTRQIRSALLDLQYGRVPDTRGWLTRLA
ncbi:branched-chain amino acid aminotransferase [Kribbella sandramycini]|uniref:Branched-chain-amino-acid aminotransferase n=1 Tax=Kribbella sandramycini TaxID=60450 RepID=A0A7Y4L307_9ACTN|nr:branched-chain amino acid aminotransferase [Kribbella sandramycini]NOL43405.1 branched-chain amino acid aminotransferase [Kribbella sandramycini]